MTPRNALAAILTPLLPTDWKIVRSSVNLDRLAKPVVIIKQQSIERLSVANQGHHEIGFVLTIVSPLENLTKAEDQLDDSTNALIHALDDGDVHWTRAEKVQYADKYLAYDVNLTLVSKKE
jgi:hypothetical protein